MKTFLVEWSLAQADTYLMVLDDITRSQWFVFERLAELTAHHKQLVGHLLNNNNE